MVSVIPSSAAFLPIISSCSAFFGTDCTHSSSIAVMPSSLQRSSPRNVPADAGVEEGVPGEEKWSIDRVMLSVDEAWHGLHGLSPFDKFYTDDSRSTQHDTLQFHQCQLRKRSSIKRSRPLMGRNPTE